MKIHKMTVYVLDFENQGLEAVKDCLRNAKYITLAGVEDAATVDVKDWDDEHPANQARTVMKDWWHKETHD